VYAHLIVVAQNYYVTDGAGAAAMTGAADKAAASRIRGMVVLWGDMEAPLGSGATPTSSYI
jgi:hypothetical protein